MYSKFREICTQFIVLSFGLLRYNSWQILLTFQPILFRVASLALWQLNDCPSASEETLKNMGKVDQNQTTTKHNKAQTICIFLGMFCISHISFMMKFYKIFS